MALQIQVTKSSTSSDCTTLIIQDSTGNYNALTNPGGYGVPNPIRANIGLKLFVTLKKTTGDIPIAISTYNEITVSQWSVTITEDGHYELFLVACDFYSNLTTYASGDIIYDSATDKFYISLQNSNTGYSLADTAWWREDPTIDEFDDANNIISKDVEDIVELCNSRVCRAQLALDVVCNCNCEDKTKFQLYDRLSVLYDAAVYAEGFGMFSDAQKHVEEIQKICSDFDCKSC